MLGEIDLNLACDIMEVDGIEAGAAADDVAARKPDIREKQAISRCKSKSRSALAPSRALNTEYPRSPTISTV